MQNQRRNKESDLLKKTSKLPQKQPAKEQSPNTQWTDFGLRAMKTDSYAEGCAGQALACSGQTLIWWPRQNTSPSTQRIDCSLRTMKTYDNAESRAGRKEDSWQATDDNIEGCNQEGTSTHSRQTLRRRITMPRVMLKEPKVLTHSGHTLVWGLRRQTVCQESCRARKGVLIYNGWLCQWLSPR